MITANGYKKASQILSRTATLEAVELPAQWQAKIRSVFGEELTAQKAVERILADVRRKGDDALSYYTEALDGVPLCDLRVEEPEIDAAYEHVSQELLKALELAAARIRDFHRACLERGQTGFMAHGLGRELRPLETVGLYVPGGGASYPSTVLMAAIPAVVAGVKRVVMTTPPKRGGMVSPATLVAARLAGVNTVFRVGGAQAIAALAYGTESIPRVDKICGPGNIFVTLAKKAVYGTVDIDGLEGPSEILILADETANPTICAADLLAQAEHDPLARAVLVTTSRELARAVAARIKAQATDTTRALTVASALKNAVIAVVDSNREAIALANEFAPEHLSLMVKRPAAFVGKIVNAGCLFVGEPSAVTLGDYVAGPSHVLPTSGTARFASPLGVNDFLKTTNVISLKPPALKKLAPAAVTIARAEGLEYHARALEKRLKPARADR